MSDIALGAVGFGCLFVLMALRMPIGLSMLLVGAVGSAAITGVDGVLNAWKTLPYEQFSSYSLSIVPLFLLMGQFATKAGLSGALFEAARSWLGHRPGGVAMAAVGACAAFGSICGSSLATAATMSQVALPEMRRLGYKGSLATGTLAAGGTLGILIPPSIVLVVYAILAGQNIDKLFIAALVPGILAALGYMAAIALYVRFDPAAGPVTARAAPGERLRALIAIWPVGLIFLLVIGGIYAGIFTPTEGAAVGACGTGILALVKGGMGRRDLLECVYGTAGGTAMIFFIVLGAAVFNGFLALSQLPQAGAAWIVGLDASPWLVLGAILLCYLVLGCLMDSLSMILLTIPIFFPIVVALDFGMPPAETALWFGILALIVVEVGMITPPVGLNVFVINSMARDVPMVETFRGVVPFLLSDFVRIALLVGFPAIALGLVRALY